MKRVCACGCGADLSLSRADAVYASPACRMRVQRADSAHKERTRLPSREGKGTRLYVTHEELRLLRSALWRLDLPPSARLNRFQTKLNRAQWRIENQ